MLQRFVFLVFVLAFILGALAACAIAGEQTPQLSYAQHAVNERVTLAGVLDAEAYDALKAMDATVVELRTAPEGVQDEARALVARGIYYVHLPISAPSVSPADVAYLQQIVDARPGKPVVVHCASGNRAAALWGAMRLEQGAALEEVLAEVAPIATKQPVIDAIKNYAAERE